MVSAALKAVLRDAAPGHPMEKPGHVRRRDRRLPDSALRHPGGARRIVEPGVRSAISSRSISGSSSPCCSPTSPPRSPRSAARPRRNRCAGPASRRPPIDCGERRYRGDFLDRVEAGRRVVVRRGQVIPGDGEIIEGVALGRRIRDHRRVRAGHSRGRRRPLGRHRRHHSDLRPHRRAHHGRRRANRFSTG